MPFCISFLILGRFWCDIAAEVDKRVATVGGAAGGFVLILSALGTIFIGNEEGLRTKAYLDVVKVPTICIGQTGRIDVDQADVHVHDTVHLGMTLTKHECHVIFQVVAERTRMALQTCVHRQLGQNQSDALISFGFNVGTGPRGACGSVVVARINAGDFAGAGDAFRNWARPPQLKGRRERERALFLKPDAPANDQPSTLDNLKKVIG